MRVRLLALLLGLAVAGLTGASLTALSGQDSELPEIEVFKSPT